MTFEQLSHRLVSLSSHWLYITSPFLKSTLPLVIPLERRTVQAVLYTSGRHGPSASFNCSSGALERSARAPSAAARLCTDCVDVFLFGSQIGTSHFERCCGNAIQ